MVNPSDIPIIAKVPEGTEAHVGQTWQYVGRVTCRWCDGRVRPTITVLPDGSLANDLEPCVLRCDDGAVSAILATGIVTAALPVVTLDTEGPPSDEGELVIDGEGHLYWLPANYYEVGDHDLSDQLALGADPQPGETWVVLDVTVLDEPQTTEHVMGVGAEGEWRTIDPARPVSGPDGWRAS